MYALDPLGLGRIRAPQGNGRPRAQTRAVVQVYPAAAPGQPFDPAPDSALPGLVRGEQLGTGEALDFPGRRCGPGGVPAHAPGGNTHRGGRR